MGMFQRLLGSRQRQRDRQTREIRKAAQAGALAALGRAQYTFDVRILSKLTASLDAAEYFSDKMITADLYKSREELLDASAGMCSVDGIVLEFGVASGHSINRLASLLPDRELHGFDSFEGLPEKWRPNFEAGHFAQDIPSVPRNVTLHKGWFSETLPSFVQSYGGQQAALLHIDCDLYSSTKTVFAHLRDMIRPGTVILFDEYFNYPGWRLHEFKAFQEFITENGLKYSYRSVVPSHNQVAVEIG